MLRSIRENNLYDIRAPIPTKETVRIAAIILGEEAMF